MGIKVCNIRVDKQYLDSDQDKMNAFLDTVTVKLTSSNFVSTATKDYWSVLIFYESRKAAQPTVIEHDLTEADKELYESLKIWRNNKAAELNLKHYMISHNSELRNIAIAKPKTKLALRKIKGFGEVKVEKFGMEILAILKV